MYMKIIYTMTSIQLIQSNDISLKQISSSNDRIEVKILDLLPNSSLGCLMQAVGKVSLQMLKFTPTDHLAWKSNSHPFISLDIVQWPEQLLNHFYLDTVIALFVCGVISLVFCQLRQGAEYKLLLS